MISLKIPKLFHALAKCSKVPFVRDDINLLTSQEWAVIEKDVRSESGKRGNKGTVRSVANQMELKTGEMPTLASAASKLGRSGEKHGFQGNINAIVRTGIARRENAPTFC